MIKPVTDKDRHPHLSPEDAATLKANYARVRKIRRDVAKATNAARGREDQTSPVTVPVRKPSPAPAQSSSDPSDDAPDFEIETWVDAKDFHAVRLAKRKVKLADVELQTAEAKRDTEMGKLIPAEKVHEDQRQMCAAFAQALSALVDLVSLWVAPDKIIQAQAAFRDLAEAKLYELSKDAE